MKLRLLMIGLALFGLLACRAKGPITAHERLGAGSESLRTAFNADRGKVRVLMLVAPT